MSNAHFRVDPRLVILLGETCRSTEQAIKELVDNAWDADAGKVVISLPAPMTDDPICIEDDGDGMTPREVENDYLKVARDRRSARGEWTSGKHRRVKGYRGIGKFAGLLVAETMTLHTYAGGQSTALTIPRKDLVSAAADLEKFKLPVDIGTCDSGRHGTAVKLMHLNQRLAFPNPDKLRQLLILEYGRETEFTIRIDGQQLSMKDIPGEQFSYSQDLPEAGLIRLNFTITDSVVKSPGVAVRVGGKIVGRPSFFGLDEDEEVPKSLLKRLYGEVEADGLLDEVTPDWNAIFDNSIGLRNLQDYVAPLLKEQLFRRFRRDFAVVKTRLKRQIDNRLAKLPQYRRQYAEHEMEKIIQKFYGESEERIAVVLSVALDAIEHDSYWMVLREVHDASRSDVMTFAEALDSFGLVDVSFMSYQAHSRLKFLDELDDLVGNPKTSERELHKAFEHNLWVLGAEYLLLASNKSLQTVIERFTEAAFKGKNAFKRPDLLLVSSVTEEFVLIEFKRPDKMLDRGDDAQAQKYRDELLSKFHPIRVVVIGGAVDLALRNAPGKDVSYFSFAQLVSRARQELRWLLSDLSDRAIAASKAN